MYSPQSASPGEVAAPVWKVYVHAIVLLVPVLAVLLVHVRIWGRDLVPEIGSIQIIAVLCVSLIVHELLHAAGFASATAVGWRNIRFGFSWRAMAPYMHCDAIVDAFTFRLAVGLPALVLGVLPITIGLASGTGWATSYGVIMMATAALDLAMLWMMRDVPHGARVRDHPDPGKLGCLVYANLRDAATTRTPRHPNA